MNLAPYRKTIAALVGAVLTWCAAALSDNAVTTMEWIALGIAVATALGVYGTPNEAEATKPPFKPKDSGLTALDALVIALIVLVALTLGLGAHPLFFLLLLLVFVVLVV